MKNHSQTVVLLASVAFFGVIWAQDGPESVTRGMKRFDKKVVVSGLAGPWELAWGPDNMLWVIERTGKRVTRIDPTTGDRTVAITIDEVSAPGGQDGLLGMAFDPDLLKGTGNDYVYVAYTYVDKAKGPHPTVTDPASPIAIFTARSCALRTAQQIRCCRVPKPSSVASPPVMTISAVA